MNTSNKTLLQILVQELPKIGGWPNNATHCVCMADKHFGNVSFTKNGAPAFSNVSNEWTILTNNYSSWHSFNFESELTIDRETAIITRDQYEAELAASKAVVGHNGWIDWHGGECPVDSDAIVEVKYRIPNPYQLNNDRAGDFTWSHDGFDDDIIAYRLQQPQEDIKTIRAEMLAVLNDAGLKITLRAAMQLVAAFIDAGYRKQ